MPVGVDIAAIVMEGDFVTLTKSWEKLYIMYPRKSTAVNFSYHLSKLYKEPLIEAL